MINEKLMKHRNGSHSDNRPLCYYKKESGSNDISSHFVESSNVHNSDRG